MKSLPRDELELISKKLTFSPDYTRFRSVCKSWRSAAPKRPQLPWLIARNQKDSEMRSSFFKFYQFSFELNKFLQIPELSELSLSSLSLSSWWWSSSSSSSSSLKENEIDCLGSFHGWMALFNQSTTSVSLFNPLTNSTIHLPTLQNRRPKIIDSGDIIFYLTSDPGESLSDCFALVYGTFSLPGFLYCKVGSTDWIEMPFQKFDTSSEFCCYRGETFITSHGDVFICDFGCSQGVRRIVSFCEDYTLTFPFENINDLYEFSYLVESDGDLLLVLDFSVETTDAGKSYNFTSIQVFKLVLGSKQAKVVELKSLDDRALFFSPQRRFSLTASRYPGCKANSIYSTYSGYASSGGAGQPIQKVSIYDLGKQTQVVINDDDVPLYVNWHLSSWFTPSLLKREVENENF